MTRAKPKPCCIQGCTAMGVVRFDNSDDWICGPCFHARAQFSPELQAAAVAEEELQTFRDEGGKPN